MTHGLIAAWTGVTSPRRCGNDGKRSYEVLQNALKINLRVLEVHLRLRVALLCVDTLSFVRSLHFSPVHEKPKAPFKTFSLNVYFLLQQNVAFHTKSIFLL